MTESLRELPDYSLVRRTAVSSSAQVYEARAPGGIPKCVKVVSLDRVGPLTEQQRSGLELLLAARHPYIVGLDRIDVGPDRVVAVYEWPNGTLRDEFRQARSQGHAGISRRRLIGWLAEAAEGLDYLHARWRVRHGALRPENLYVFSGHVKLGEFGPLRDLEKGGGLGPQEIDCYLGPEPETASPSAQDQYSLAVVYCELLSGNLPYRANALAELRRLQREVDPDLRNVPLSDWPALERALSPDPERRFPTCRDFVVGLYAAHAEPPEEDADEELPGSTILDAGWHSVSFGGNSGAETTGSALDDPEFASVLEQYRAEQDAVAGPSNWSSNMGVEQLTALLALSSKQRGWAVEPGAEPGALLIAGPPEGGWGLQATLAPRRDGSVATFAWSGAAAGRPELSGLTRELGLRPADPALQRASAREPWRGTLSVTTRSGALRSLRIAGLGIDISSRGLGFWTPMPMLCAEVLVERRGDPMARPARVVRCAQAPGGRPGYVVGLELLAGSFDS